VIDDVKLLVIVNVFEDVVTRKIRLLLGRPHVREDHPAELLNRVPGLPIRRLVATTVRLARLVSAGSISTERPPVVRATDAILFDAAVKEARAAMTASRFEQAWRSIEGSIQHEVFAEQPHLARDGRRLARQRHRLPIATQQFARRRAGASLKQFRVGNTHWPSVGASVIHHCRSPHQRALGRSAE
jgi:hypothetical protein